jgi:hypothetical protein
MRISFSTLFSLPFSVVGWAAPESTLAVSVLSLRLKCPRSKRESQGRKREQTGRPIKRAFLAFFHSPLFSLLLYFNAFASRERTSQFRTLLHHFQKKRL